MENTAVIFRIQRFSVNDGPGIRTTVFMKGCPLNCLWCHNPESKNSFPELSFVETKCVFCGNCSRACSNSVHHMEGSIHHLERTNCVSCGKCVESCYGALEIIGKRMTVSQVMEEVRKDRAFYRESGGITVSGGEPLLHPMFLMSLLKAAKEENIHTCIETSGFAQWESIRQILPYTDLFYYDIKETDPERHKKYTGAECNIILSNLRSINRIQKAIVLRCPIIPGYNDRHDHFLKIAELANELESVVRVDVEPYHPLGAKKAADIGREYQLLEIGFPDQQKIDSWIQRISVSTFKKVVQA